MKAFTLLPGDREFESQQCHRHPWLGDQESKFRCALYVGGDVVVSLTYQSQ